MDVHHKDYYSECQLVSDDTRNEARAVTENTNSSNAGDVDEVYRQFGMNDVWKQLSDFVLIRFLDRVPATGPVNSRFSFGFLCHFNHFQVFCFIP